MSDFAFKPPSGGKKVYIDHHPHYGEYKVHLGSRIDEYLDHLYTE